MRTTTINVVPVSVDTNIMLAPASPNRVRIEFRVSGDTRCIANISPIPLTAQNGHSQGVVLSSSDDPDGGNNSVIFDYRDHGDIVRSTWYTYIPFPDWLSGQNPSIAVIETFR